jgi:hypothetical protein
MSLRYSASAVVVGTLASACAVVPVTTQNYDPDCRIVTHHMTLKAKQLGLIAGCNGDGDCLLVYLAVLGGSAIVSGSVVVVGNVVYWAEERAACLAPGAVRPDD